MAQQKNFILDTNYLVRLVVRDVPAQTDEVVKLVETASNNSLIVSEIVFCEAVYVLEKVYEFKREVTAKALAFVLDHPAFNVASDSLHSALEVYVNHPKLSFVDCYAWTHSTRTKSELLSFDKDLNKIAKEKAKG